MISQRFPIGESLNLRLHVDCSRCPAGCSVVDRLGGAVGVCNRKPTSRKSNQQPLAYEVHAAGNGTALNFFELTSIEALTIKVSLAQRIKAFLRAGARQGLASQFPWRPAETLRRTVDREINWVGSWSPPHKAASNGSAF